MTLPTTRRSAIAAVEGTGRRTRPMSIIEQFELFDDFIAIDERSGGLLRLRTLRASGKSSFVASDEPAYTMGLAANAEPDTRVAALHLHLADHAEHHLRGEHRHRRAQAAQARAGARRLRPGQLRRPSGCGRRRATAPRSRCRSSTARASSKDGTAAMLQYAYGSYGTVDRSGFLGHQCQPARSRHGLCDRAHPRRPGNGPRLVRRRPPAEARRTPSPTSST